MVADVYERDLALVKVSQVARVNVEAYPSTDFGAVVASIGDVVDPNTRTIKVRAWVDNQEQKLKPEMFARLRLDVGDALPFLAIPKEAVVEIDGKHFVYLVEAGDKFVKKEVKVSSVSAEFVRVLEGLTPGERIVTKGAVLVRDRTSRDERSHRMIARIVELSLVQRFLICTLGLTLLFGGLYAFHLLDIVAYPDPSPPMVEVITQYPGWSAEEIERQITIPLEVALNGMPGLADIRSLSIFGLSDIKIYFDFDTNYFFDRQEVINRLATVTLPQNVQPTLSPWWAIAEIYRYELEGIPQTSLTDLKTIQDWQLRREFRRIPGVIDVTAFGGTTREYHVDIDPGKLISYGVSLAQVMEALSNSNANVGGNYLTVGGQNYNIRGLGLINNLQDIENVMVVEKEGTPIFVKTLGSVTVGHRVRLGKVGIDDKDDVVEGVILLQRGTRR
ncbi:MAG: efflux RND transporter permease subunit [Nitrospiraceae bacterium]